MKIKVKAKMLGQHFLINKNKLQKIVEALDLESNDTVIEIGPGHGELTRLIAEKCQNPNVKCQIIAIEKDTNFVKSLEEKLSPDKNIEIIEGDALKILPKIINSISGASDVPRGSTSQILTVNSQEVEPPKIDSNSSIWRGRTSDTNKNQSLGSPTSRTSDAQKLKIVGNIPYYITGHLLRVLGELKNKPSLVVLTIQKEVAERICAFRQAQGKPKMNLLAASVQFWAEPEIIDYIPKTDFRPQPKVDSAIIKLKSITISMRPHEKCYEIEAEEYYKLIKILFKQPRKTILNNLASGVRLQVSGAKSQKPKEEIIKILEELKINPGDRPQNLTIEQIKKLAKLIKI